MKQKLLRIVKSAYFKNVVIATAVSMPLLVINLAILHNTKAYISDDVIQQNILQQWQTEPKNAIVGEDTFILKLPFYFIVSKVINNSPSTLFITALCFLIIMFLIFNAFQFLIHKDRRLGILLSLYIASYGGIELLGLRTPNLRNLELPLAMMTAWVISQFIYGKIQFNRYLFVLLVLFASLQVLNDPYVFYVLFFPTIIVTYLISNRKIHLIKIVSVWAIVFLLWKIFAKLASLSGLDQISQIIKFNPQKMASDTYWALKGSIVMLGNAQPGGHLRNSALVCCVIVILIIAILVNAWRKRTTLLKIYKNSPFEFWGITYGISVVFVCMSVYIASGMISELLNVRYLVVLPFALAIIIAGAKKININIKYLYVLIPIIITFNILLNFRSLYYAKTVNNLADYNSIAAFASTNKVYIGFADYWDSNINTYYSNDKIRIFPIVCSSTQDITIFRWASNLDAFPENIQSVKRYFIYINDKRAESDGQSLLHTSTCTTKDVQKILGAKIVRTTTLDKNRSIMLIQN